MIGKCKRDKQRKRKENETKGKPNERKEEIKITSYKKEMHAHQRYDERNEESGW